MNDIYAFFEGGMQPGRKVMHIKIAHNLILPISAEHVANTRTGIRNLVNDVVRKIRITVMMQGTFVSACWGEQLVLQSRKRSS